MAETGNKHTVDQGMANYGLSRRGATNFAQEDPWGPMEAALSNPWTPENPSGIVIMRFAENSLMHHEIAAHVEKKLQVSTAQHLTYGHGPRGSPRLRKALADFLNSPYFAAREPVTDQQIIVMSGVSSIIEAFTWSVCDEGEGILIPQPLYTGYQLDITQRSRGILVPVPYQGIEGYSSFEDAFRADVTVKAFKRALEKAEKDDVKVKAVILSHPHNPLGRCYPVDVIKEIARFCGQHRLHLVSNEIYANSIYDNGKASGGLTPFQSILSLDLGSLIDPNLVHVFYGASKDFCMNGLRMGMIQSRSQGLLTVMTSLSPFSWTPYLTQDIWAGMLEDSAFLEKFFSKNRDLLTEHFGFTTALLEKHNIPYYKGCNAGMFIWIDLRRYIRGDFDLSALRRVDDNPHTQTLSQREKFIDETFMKNGVSVAQGSIFFTEEWGWFRLTFTLPQNALELGIQRMVKSLEEVQRLGWETVDNSSGESGGAKQLEGVMGHLSVKEGET